MKETRPIISRQYSPQGIGFAGIKNERQKKPWSLVLWFQRATEGKVGMGGVPERLLGTGVKVKPKLQWRTQDVDESRTMKHFWWNDVEWSCLKREAIELVGVGLPRPFGTPDTQHESIRFRVALMGFGPAFIQLFLAVPQFSHFGVCLKWICPIPQGFHATM